MTEPASDGQLLRRSADGDREAFTELMDRHADPVYRFLRSLGASPDDAEDAVQESFVAGWKNASAFRGEASARGWLFAIARNAHRRNTRRRAGEPVEHEPLEALGAAAGWGAQDDFAHRLEVREELAWAFSRLPAEERAVVVLRDVHGLSGEEAAEAMGLSLAAMKSRLHRGRLRLMGIVRGREDAHV